ncbi:uncharacterized protein LOC144349443 [Saccoglossus kowalevskii]
MAGARRKSYIPEPEIKAHEHVLKEYARPENYVGSLDAIRLISKLHAQGVAKEKDIVEECAREKPTSEKTNLTENQKKVQFLISRYRDDDELSGGEESRQEEEERMNKFRRLGLDYSIEFPFPASAPLTPDERKRIATRRKEARRNDTMKTQVCENGSSYKADANIASSKESSTAAVQRPGSKPELPTNAPNLKASTDDLGSLRKSIKSKVLRRCKSDSDIASAVITSNMSPESGKHSCPLRHSWEKMSATYFIKRNKMLDNYLSKSSSDRGALKTVAKQRRRALVSSSESEKKNTSISRDTYENCASKTPREGAPARRRSSTVNFGRRMSIVITDDVRSGSTGGRRASLCQIRPYTAAEIVVDTSPSATRRSSVISMRAMPPSRRGKIVMYDIEKEISRALVSTLLIFC